MFFVYAKKTIITYAAICSGKNIFALYMRSTYFPTANTGFELKKYNKNINKIDYCVHQI